MTVLRFTLRSSMLKVEIRIRVLDLGFMNLKELRHHILSHCCDVESCLQIE